jgi:molecular chaperone DnaK (HSP70)
LKEDILKVLLKSDFHDFDKSFNNEIFTENKKYLAECYNKYHELLNSFSGTANSVHLEFRYILNETIEIEITRDEVNQALEDTHKEIQKIIDDTKRFLQENHLDLASVALLIIGNGFKFPGVKDLFKKEFPDNFHQRQVFCDEEIIEGALKG